jgi:hypothetical protein
METILLFWGWTKMTLFSYGFYYEFHFLSLFSEGGFYKHALVSLSLSLLEMTQIALLFSSNFPPKKKNTKETFSLDIVGGLMDLNLILNKNLRFNPIEYFINVSELLL